MKLCRATVVNFSISYEKNFACRISFALQNFCPSHYLNYYDFEQKWRIFGLVAKILPDKLSPDKVSISIFQISTILAFKTPLQSASRKFYDSNLYGLNLKLRTCQSEDLCQHWPTTKTLLGIRYLAMCLRI